jgi:hypothetical protein
MRDGAQARRTTMRDTRTPNRFANPWPRIAFAPGLLLALLAAACGGSGGSLPVTTEDGATAVLLSASPDTIDRDGGERLRLEGTGLGAGLVVVVRDEDGMERAVATLVAAAADGLTAEVVLPPIAGPGEEVELLLSLRDAEGNESEPVRVTARREYPSFDGTGNNRDNPDWGAAGTTLLRPEGAAYADGVSALAGPERPGPREVSNAICAQEGDLPNEAWASDMLWQWGQFLDHDLDLTGGAVPTESAPIPVPTGDPFFDPQGTGTVVMPFSRSAYAPGSVPRQQVNSITAWIDASQVYGSDEARARALRTLDGTGRMKTSDGELLPFNLDGIANAGGPNPALFVAGDIRANEQVGLMTIHALFVREHNRIADAIRARHPTLTDDEIFLEARRSVAAEIQVITYREFLPLLLGDGALPPYRGLVEDANPGIRNAFSTAAFRLGHTLLSDTLLRLDAALNEIPEGHLALRDSFFDPTRLTEEGGIDPVLRGLVRGRAQELDSLVIDDVRNFLFGPPGAGGFDLASLNLQRGRDHGLLSYEETRAALGLPRRGSFDAISSDPAVVARFASVYGSVDEVDLWIGALAEDHLPGAMVGETLRAILVDQFRRLRDGDRFWYERILSGPELDAVRASRLSDVIRRNTAIRGEIQDDAFRVPRPGGPRPPRREPGPLPVERRALLESLDSPPAPR